MGAEVRHESETLGTAQNLFAMAMPIGFHLDQLVGVVVWEKDPSVACRTTNVKTKKY